jgi:glycosyltransferase involved in cell wall biosynthesis
LPKGIIIIPTYNEEQNIGRVIREIKSRKVDIDIIVIDDGSTDRTREIVENENVDVISHIHNLGYGAALQTGFRYSIKRGYKFVIQFDGDGQHDPDDILPMVEELQKGESDIVIGSRFLGKGSFKMGVLKQSLVNFMKLIIKVSTGTKISDPTSGFKGLSKRTYRYYSQKENFPHDYPDADILIQMLRRKYKVNEIPANIRYRTKGKSMHAGLKPVVYLMKILLSIIIVLLRERLIKEG